MSVPEKDIQQQAADAIEELLADKEYLLQLVDERDEELTRIYEIASVFHQVAKAYLEHNVAGQTPEEQEAVDIVKDAVLAIETGSTLSTARLLREEEISE